MNLYLYKARLATAVEQPVYDADTVRLDIDLGLKQWTMNEPVRLFGINAPEVRGDQRPAGIRSRDVLRYWLRFAAGKLLIETHKDGRGKFGRWLGTIYVPTVSLKMDLPGDVQDRIPGFTNVNQLLVARGYAEEATY